MKDDEELEINLLNLIYPHTRSKVNNEILHSIELTINSIEDILRYVDNDRAEDTLTEANITYGLAQGYMIYNKKELSDVLGVSERKIKQIVEGLINDNIIERIDLYRSSFLKECE